MKIFIETERLILRELSSNDDKALFELDSNPIVHKYIGKEPVSDIEFIREVIAMIQKQYLENGIGRWAVIDRKSDKFIGWSGLKLVKELTNKHINYYDLGYRFIPEYWGKGIATEAAIAIVNYGFEKMNLTEIFGMCESENKASRKVLEKSGLKLIETFNNEGIFNDWLKIQKEDWRK
ncbi:MAG: GNAT family N-acetyltransferase [Saprospiraceae bacterium]